MVRRKDTSWEVSAEKYDKVVGSKGHYYHQRVVIPGVLRLMGKGVCSVLDLGCGQGVLARHLDPTVVYVGIDASSSLIERAATYFVGPNHQFFVHNLENPLQINKKFSCAVCILALQNLKSPLPLFRSAASHLEDSGQLILVLNHPIFRIPRQTSWGIDPQKKVQYRRVDRYMSPMEIPIQMNPGQGMNETVTWSFHYPLSFYSHKLQEAGFVISVMEEWCSDKSSIGKAAAMENRSRQEFPLFLTIVAKRALT